MLAGSLQGVAWAYLAPGVPYKVLADGRYGALPTTSTYYFVGRRPLRAVRRGDRRGAGGRRMAVVSARGWPMVVTLAAARSLGALIAWWLGALLAPGVDPAAVGATAADSIVMAPPTTDTLLVVFVQPAIAAAVYTFLVAWNGRPDLGRVMHGAPAPAAGTPRTDPSPGTP